jgi:Rod binding domain-containing protein
MQAGELQIPRVADLGRTSQQLARVERARGADDATAAQQLEALFATMLVREMRRAVPEGFFGQGSHAEVYEGWLDEHVGAALARDGALDLAGMIKANLGTKRASAGESE